MSECVVRMEMPKNCKSCRLCKFIGASPECALKKHPFDTVSQYYYADKKPSYCPVNCQLPEGHGRLVDADALHKIAWPVKDHTGRIEECVQIRDLYKAPTVVPAERSET